VLLLLLLLMMMMMMMIMISRTLVPELCLQTELVHDQLMYYANASYRKRGEAEIEGDAALFALGVLVQSSSRKHAGHGSHCNKAEIRNTMNVSDFVQPDMAECAPRLVLPQSTWPNTPTLTFSVFSGMALIDGCCIRNHKRTLETEIELATALKSLL
jgi:hypothetical protein